MISKANKGYSTFSWLLASLLVFQAGCAAIPMPIVMDPSFSERNVRTIALLPIVDRRRDSSAKIDLEHQFGLRAEKKLKSKGYNVVRMSELDLSRDPYGPERLQEMDPEYIASLGSKDADAVLAIYVDDILNNYKVMIYEFKAEATATLVSKSDSRELWRAKGIGTYGYTGLISGVFQLLDRSIALDHCSDSMLFTLPKAVKVSQRAVPSKESAMQPALETASN